MIADLKPYTEYKESRLPWLGPVPGHWQECRVKNLALSGYRTFVDGDWIESPFIRGTGIRIIQTGNIGVGLYREKGYRFIDEVTFQAFGCTEFQAGDVLICRLGDPVGRACLPPNLGVRMITSVDVCILKTRQDVSPAFVVYMMSAPQYLHWVGSLIRGSTRERVSRSMLGGFMIPLPPHEDHTPIVRFLEWATGRLERAIRAKRNVIALLERIGAEFVLREVGWREKESHWDSHYEAARTATRLGYILSSIPDSGRGREGGPIVLSRNHDDRQPPRSTASRKDDTELRPSVAGNGPETDWIRSPRHVERIDR